MTGMLAVLAGVLMVGLPADTCERPELGTADRDADEAEADDKDGSQSELCAAAEVIDDACEQVHGDDAAVCTPFDAIDEACEAGDADDADGSCAGVEALADACEAVFSEDAPECAAADELDGKCG